MAADRQRVWTDGACKGNPGPGGWGWVDDAGRWANGCEAESTNQRMEIMAAFDAVRGHDGPITVISDSTYVVNCFRDGWWKGWLARDWKNSQRKPVANRDLWEPFIDLVTGRDDVAFEWVKGHAGDEMNDIADRLAVAAAATQTAQSGDELPDDVDAIGAPDTVGADSSTIRSTESDAGGATESSTNRSQGGGRDKRLPAGRLLGVFGARPTELGGYDENPTAAGVRRRLREIIEAKATLESDLHVVSGLRLGAEMLGAEAAAAAGVPFVAVLPFPDPDSPWPSSSRKHFAELRAGAAAEVLLERKVPDSTAKVAGSLRRRDAWLARNIDEAIVVWDGQDRFVARLLDTLRDRLGADVWEEIVPS